LIGLITLFGLFGKYSGFNPQLNKFISIFLSILITKVVLIELIIFFIPYIGLSTYTKPMVYFLSIGGFYVLFRLMINILLFSFESSNKNRAIDGIMGGLFGIINGILGLAIILSIFFYSFKIKENTIDRLNESLAFNYIYTIKIALVDYEK
jgi:uncharacterized membrane protein required for colicin V production